MATTEIGGTSTTIEDADEGQVALVRDGKVVEVFDNYTDALRSGLAKFGYSENFSVCEVSRRVA